MATRTGRDIPQSMAEYNKRRIFVQNIEYNLLNTHSGNVVTYRYMKNRRKVLGMSCDSVRILDAINTATSLQGRLTESEFSGEEFFHLFMHCLYTVDIFVLAFVKRE